MIITASGNKSYHFKNTREEAEAWLERQRKYLNISASLIEPHTGEQEDIKVIPNSVRANPIRKREQPANSQGAEPKCSPCEEARRKREEENKNKNQ